MTRIHHVAIAALALAAIQPAPAHAQGGVLGRIKQKAAEKVVEKATDRGKGADSTRRGAAATPRDTGAPATPREEGGRRSKPLDATRLESPGAGGAPTTWNGQGMTLEQFRSTIPELTESRLATYMRARRAYLAEAERVTALRKSDGRALRALMGPSLAADEKPPLPGYMLLWPMAGPQRVERHLEGVLDQSLAGDMTRMQFYQMHEMVEMYLNRQVNQSVATTGAVGRKLAKGELDLLDRHSAELVALREQGKKL